MAGGSPELEHLLPNSAESWRARGNTYGDFVMGYFAMSGAMGSTE
jgi:hypothetical protein